MKKRGRGCMANEFLEFGPKVYTYKIFGDTTYTSDMRNVVSVLNQVEGIIPTSIKVYGMLDDNCKFKFKGTEKALRNLLSELSVELEFNVKKVKKVLF